MGHTANIWRHGQGLRVTRQAATCSVASRVGLLTEAGVTARRQGIRARRGVPKRRHDGRSETKRCFLPTLPQDIHSTKNGVGVRASGDGAGGVIRARSLCQERDSKGVKLRGKRGVKRLKAGGVAIKGVRVPSA
jgi:hypothetical protein